METILAAANQTYDKSSFRVFVLDDGRTESLRKAVEDLNSNIDSGTIGDPDDVYPLSEAPRVGFLRKLRHKVSRADQVKRALSNSVSHV